jgi:two-component system, chemotaxis family, protein-glutamate methylesterase/glutaminase
VIAKVKIAASTAPPYQTPTAPGLKPLMDFTGRDRIVALGGSTGAVAVVQHILAALPEKMPPILVAVHMPAQFTRQFANRLNKICRLEVVEAEHGMTLVRGRVIIAPGDRHLTVTKSRTGHVCRVEEGPRVNGHVPSVDVLFESLAGVAGEAVMGIVLTGMGRDGALGLKAIRAAGGITACQDEASSLIYGMPRAAVAEGAVMHQRGLKDLAAFILEHVQSMPAGRGVPVS